MSLRIKIPVAGEYFERGSTSEQKIVIGYQTLARELPSLEKCQAE